MPKALTVPELTQRIADLETQNATLTAEKTTLESQIATDKTAQEGQVATLTAEKGTLEGQVTTLTAEKGTLEGQVTTLTAEKATLTGEVTALQASAKTADQRAQEIAAAHGSAPAAKTPGEVQTKPPGTKPDTSHLTGKEKAIAHFQARLPAPPDA